MMAARAGERHDLFMWLGDRFALRRAARDDSFQ